MSTNKPEYIFIVDRDGTVNRLKLPYGGQDAAMEVLKATSVNSDIVRLDCPDYPYLSLRRTLVFVIPRNCYPARCTLVKYLTWLRGKIEGHVWYVRGFSITDPGGEPVGVSSCYATALKLCCKWDTADDDEDHYATIELVPTHE